MLLHISKWFLFTFLCQKHNTTFLRYSLREPGRDVRGKTQVPLRVLTLRVVHIEPPAIHQLQLKFPYTCSWQGYCSDKLSFTVFSMSLPNFKGNGMPSDFSSLIDLRKILDFSVCSAFYLLLQWNGNFQASYMSCQKPEACIFF